MFNNSTPAKICSWSYELSWSVHERSWKCMNGSCSVHQKFCRLFMNKFSWTVHKALHQLFMKFWWIKIEFMNFVFINILIHECSWMFISIISWTNYSWKFISIGWWQYHEIFMNFSKNTIIMNVHECSYWLLHEQIIHENFISFQVDDNTWNIHEFF